MDDHTLVPNGILLNLCKHIDAARLDPDKIRNNYVELKAKICFGNFDRLRFYPIENFTDFRNQSRTGHLWTGGRRDIMLFSLSKESSERIFRFSRSSEASSRTDNPYGSVLPWEIQMLDNGVPTSRKFLSVSMLYLSDIVKNLGMPYGRLVNNCKEAISTIVDKVNEYKRQLDSSDTIIFEVFGSLNSAELAILWGSNQYIDIQYIVDHLRYLQLEKGQDKYRLFFSSYTIVAINDKAACDLAGVHGGAMIQFTTTTNSTAPACSCSKAMGYLRKKVPGSDSAKDVYSCSGEYDYIYKGAPQVLHSMFNPDSPADFDDCNKEFQEHFSSSTTRLYYLEEELRGLDGYLKQFSDLYTISPPDSHFDLPDRNDLSHWSELPQVFNGCRGDGVRTKYIEYTKALKERLSWKTNTVPSYRGLSVSNLLYNLDLLFCDYVQCVSTMPNLQWAKDYEFQFSSALTVLESTMPSIDELAEAEAKKYTLFVLDDYIERCHQIIRVLRDSIHHMAEAGKLFFEEPSSHSQSTSQYDLIIHTYYGIIKNVLLEIAKNSKHLCQSPTRLIPILRFSEQPIIKSKLFVDEMELERKIVEIGIPYDACGEIGLYSPLLIHELYHYVPPVNRDARNMIFTVILLTELTVDLLQQICKENEEALEINDADLSEILLKFRELLIQQLKRAKVHKAVRRTPPGSTNWGALCEDILWWVKGVNENGEPSPFFQQFFEPILDKINSDLNAWCKKRSEDDGTKRLVGKLVVILTPSEKSKNRNNSMDLLYRLSNCSRMTFDDIAQALREMLPDYAMVHYPKITDLSDYLLIMAIVIDKQYSRAADANNLGFLQFRIGFIADYILYKFNGNMEKLETDLDKLGPSFREKYNAYRRLGVRNDSTEQSEDYCKEAGMWFELFKSRLIDNKSIYLLYRRLLKQLAEEQFAPGMQEARETVWDSLTVPFSKMAKSKAEHFQAELDIIRAFQPQRFLVDLQDRDSCTQSPHPQSPNPTASTKKQKPHLVFRVEHGIEASVAINAASELLKTYHCRVFGRQSHPQLWFRGCKSSSYPILPSIMGRFLERDKTCPNGKNYIGSLVEYQRALLDEFRCRADGAREFINASSYTTADYIALMQHYSQQTCYLDWSDDAYSSLYFALEYEIAQAQAIIKKKSPDQEALEPVLFLFDPKLYNLARLRLLNRFSTKIKEQFQLDSDPAKPNCTADRDLQAIFETVAKDLAEAEQIEKDLKSERLTDINVPNISVRSTAKRYGIHSLNLIQNSGIKDCALRSKNIKTKEDLKSATFTKYNSFKGDLWNLPLAVYTSRLNPRIRSQSGNFLAYSVFSRPVCCENEKTISRALCEDDEKKLRKTDYFKYLSLKDIQDFYLKVFEKDPNPGVPFLLEVIIPSGEKKQLAEYLYHAGFNKYRIYPELDNLSLS